MKKHLAEYWLNYLVLICAGVVVAVISRVADSTAPYYEAIGGRVIDGTATASDMFIIGIIGVFFIVLAWRR